ncbi:T-complex protein 11-domain-containing protein [Gautieria morchelliformis]|nr:T-complex protein 11-domain-containing protein [Gautieria morchelliformis]
MEHSPPVSRKRKASQSSPVQEHRCIPAEDPPAVLHDAPPPPAPDIPDPASLYSSDDAGAHRPKRPRLTLDSPPTLERSRRATPPRRRATPRPVAHPQPHHHELSQVYPTQQYSLRRPSVPVPSRSLLSPLESPSAASPVVPAPPEYRPPLLPTITRDTLRELELDTILKNPQLRHDLLFDPGLQFRPTTTRRKQLATDRYWVAVTREIEDNCTCTAWDASGAIMACSCLRKSDKHPKDGPLEDGIIRKPKRARPMLHEFMAVLKSVIVPQSVNVPCSSKHAPGRLILPAQSASDARHLLSHFDPPLVEQELKRGIYDPQGLFGLVGETLKRHCAPMRDRQVDDMINASKGSQGTSTRRALMAMRLCFEILELMKLDIANHQLQHLRPFLAATTPDFELAVFIERCRRKLISPRITRVWLQNAWDKVNISPPPAAGSRVKEEDTHVSISTPLTDTLSRRNRIHVSLIDAITSLVFNPSRLTPSIPGMGYPETLYLDTARVTLLAGDAADLTALYMLLMLWRQLVFWSPASGEDIGEGQNASVFPPYTRGTPRLENWEVDRMKREIWGIGPRRMGSCFLLSRGKDGYVTHDVLSARLSLIHTRTEDTGEENMKWRNAMQNVALQIAMRAEEARACTSTERASTADSVTTRRPPSQAALDLMSGWIQSHMRRDSALAGRLRTLLRQEVAHVVSQLTFATASCNESAPGSVGMKAPTFIPESGGGTAGLEPLMPEIRHLAQRLAKLVLVNMRVYCWSLYEADGFLVEKAKVETS